MSLSIQAPAFGATRVLSSPKPGTLTVQFERLLPSGETISGGATLVRNDEEGTTLTVTRCGPNGRTGDRTWVIMPPE